MKVNIEGWGLSLGAIFYYGMVLLGVSRITGDTAWGVLLGVALSIGFMYWLYRLTDYAFRKGRGGAKDEG